MQRSPLQRCHLLDAVVDIPILFSMNWQRPRLHTRKREREKRIVSEEHKMSIAIVIIARRGRNIVLKVRVIFQLARFTSTLWRISGISGRHNILLVYLYSVPTAFMESRSDTFLVEF